MYMIQVKTYHEKLAKDGKGTRFSTQWQSLSALLKMMNTWLELVVHAPMPSSPLSFLIHSSHDRALQRINISKGPCSAADAMVRQQGMALAKEDPRDSKTGCKISGGNAPLDVFDAMAGKKHGKQVAFAKVGKNWGAFRGRKLDVADFEPLAASFETGMLVWQGMAGQAVASSQPVM